MVYEMIGRDSEIEGTIDHRFVLVVIPPGKLNSVLYHKALEEAYYVLQGVGSIRFHAVSLEHAIFLLYLPTHNSQFSAIIGRLNFLLGRYTKYYPTCVNFVIPWANF